MWKWAESDADNTTKIENLLIHVNGYHSTQAGTREDKTAKCNKVTATISSAEIHIIC